jgi:hypothetical protein
MAIPSRQIGWGTEENLLWQISKQLEYLTTVVYNIPNNTTTTTTTTAAPGFFSGTVDILGAPYCGTVPLDSFIVTGNGSTFCNSTEFSGEGFTLIPPVNLALQYGIDLVEVTADGSSVAIVQVPCYNC